MLKLEGAAFTIGRSKFLDRIASNAEPSAKIFVRIALLGLETMAMVDTGAAVSMLEMELAEELGLLDGEGEEIAISTRLGLCNGRLERIDLTLLADEGEALIINASVFVSRQWTGKTFLGYAGLLDHVRIALDPPTNHFYFGEVGDSLS